MSDKLRVTLRDQHGRPVDQREYPIDQLRAPYIVTLQTSIELLGTHVPLRVDVETLLIPTLPTWRWRRLRRRLRVWWWRVTRQTSR